MNAVAATGTRLSELLRGLAQVPAHLDVPVTGLACDSRSVAPGDLFLAAAGLHHHGLDFLEAARAAGACAVAWEPPYAPPPQPGLPLVAVPGLGRHLGTVASRFHDHPSHHLAVVGITGTDGKTSCAHFIAQALSGTGEPPCGLLGTLGYGVWGALEPATHTTPDALRVQQALAALVARGSRRVAMEVSSHALAQGRTEGVRFAVAVLTNITRDHLDYHGSEAAYAAAKRQLFYSPGLGHAVLNLDDPHGQALARDLASRLPVVGYGVGAPPPGLADWVRARRVELMPAGLRLEIDSSRGAGRLATGLLGRFNASNLLASLATLIALGIPLAESLERLGPVRTVAGRMERFGGGGRRPLAVVDYAHTPHALEQVLGALREHCTGRLWCVFGCGGDRDQGKRPVMGEVARRLADRVIVTDDNPRGEAPERIVAQILAGMSDANGAEVIHNRGEAITAALERAGRNDVVLVAGKGHEDYQLVGSERRAFSDREWVRRWMEDAR